VIAGGTGRRGVAHATPPTHGDSDTPAPAQAQPGERGSSGGGRGRQLTILDQELDARPVRHFPEPHVQVLLLAHFKVDAVVAVFHLADLWGGHSGGGGGGGVRV